MGVTFPGESAEYRAARDRLLEQEAEMRRAIEAVAAARRELPPGGAVAEDYVFQGEGPDGAPTDVRLSELFAPGKDTLVIYSMMFPRPPTTRTCLPVVHAVPGLLRRRRRARLPARQRRDRRQGRAAAPARPSPPTAAGATCACSRRRNNYNRDYHGETPDGAQQLPMLNVFRRDGDGIRHFWGSELLYEPPDPGQDPRHAETIDPLWNLFDFAPEGRGTDWYPELSY